MSPVLERVAQLAFHRAAPNDANVAIDAVRARRGAEGDAVSYEIALPGLAPDDFLTRQALAKLVYFLDCRGVKPPSSGGVFVSLFSAEGLWFVEAGPLVQVLADARGLTLFEVVRRYGANGVGDPPLLGA